MSDIRVVLDLVEERGKLASSRGVRFLSQNLDSRPLLLPVRVTRLDGRGRAAVGTELVVRRQRLIAVSTSFSNLVGGRVLIDDTCLVKDVRVMLLSSYMFVRFPHIGVKRPMDPVLDLRPGESLTSHACDRGMAEVVGVHWLVQLGSDLDSLQMFTEGFGVERTVVGPSIASLASAPRFDLVKESDTRLVWPGVRRPQIRTDSSGRVDQWVLCDGSALEPNCIIVRCVSRSVPEREITHAQGQRQADSGAGICEELDDSNVPLAPSSFTERLDIFREQHLVGGDLVLLDRRSLDFFRPIAIELFSQEQTDSILVAFDRRVSQVVVMAQREDEIVVGVFSEFDERDVRSLARGSDSAEIRLQRGDGDRPVLCSQPSFDGFPVGVVDVVGVSKQASLAFETTLKILGIVDGHTSSLAGSYYKLPTVRSTSFTHSETIEASSVAGCGGGVAA